MSKDFIFCLRPNRKRERERDREKKKASFSLQFTSFRRSDLVGLRVKVSLRDESSTWVPESQDFAKVQSSGFHENREKVVSQEIILLEVGFFSYSG